jgi:hypothetical protein
MSTRAAQVELLVDSLIDPTTGSVCSGYSVEFYAAGTSTPKNVWTEKEKTNPFTTYTLDSGGKALLYGDGTYKINVKNIDGTIILPLDNQKIQSTTFSIVQKIGTYTVTPDDDVILCNGTFTVSLAEVSTFEHPVIIKSIGTGTITIYPNGSETIDGSSPIVISNQYDAITLYPDIYSNVWRKSGSLTADLNGTELILDADGDTSITADTPNVIDFKVGGADQLQLMDGVLRPSVNSDINLGSESPTNRFKDISMSGTGVFYRDGVPQGRDITVAIHRKIVNIGDWDMDATGIVTVAHGLTLGKIRNISGMIRNDADSLYLPFPGGFGSLSVLNSSLTIYQIDSTNVTLARESASVYDNNSYDSTAFNRGWLIIEYVD